MLRGPGRFILLKTEKKSQECREFKHILTIGLFQKETFFFRTTVWHLLFQQFRQGNSIFCKTKWYICVFCIFHTSLPNIKLEESTLQQFLKEGKMGIPKTKRKHKLNLGWGIVFSQRMCIRKTCKETSFFFYHIDKSQQKKKKDVWKVRENYCRSCFCRSYPVEYKKRLNILSEGCRETVAGEKDAVSIVKL